MQSATLWGKTPERSLCSLPREAGQTAGVSFWAFALGANMAASDQAGVAIASDSCVTINTPAFLAKLDGVFVSVNPIFPAEHVGGSFSFNQAFAGGKAVFAAGEAVGVLGFAAQGQ